MNEDRYVEGNKTERWQRPTESPSLLFDDPPAASGNNVKHEAQTALFKDPVRTAQ